jgi:SSS family solute:Na+ symporter
MMMTFKGFLRGAGRPGTKLRYAEDPVYPLARRSQQNERFCKRYFAAYPLFAYHKLNVLGLLYYHQMNLKDATGAIDFERILPAVINNFLPVGLVGLLLAGLLGAFMSTLAVP